MAREERSLSAGEYMALETLKELLTCQLCTEKYDDADRRPKFLPCLHGFCISCLSQYAEGKPMFKCPVCRRDIPVPDGGVHQLPDNFVARQLKYVECLDAHRPRCGLCVAGGGPVVSFCSHVSCKTFLCQRCHDAHRTMCNFVDHVVHSEELQKPPEIPTSKQNLQCKEHKHMPLSLYCDEESCQKAICRSCAAAGHSSHRYVDLDQKSTEAKEELQNLATDVLSKIKSTHLISGQIQTEINRISEVFDEKSGLVSAFFNDLHALIKKRHDAVIAELKKRCFDMTGHLRHLADSAESLASQFDTASQFADDVCSIGNPVELLNSRAQVISRLYELQAIDVDKAIPFHPDREADFLSFNEDHNLVDEFERLLLRLKQTKATGTSFKVEFPRRAASRLYGNVLHRVRVTTEDYSSSSFTNLRGRLHAYLQSPDGSTVECSDVEQCDDNNSCEFEFRPLAPGLHQLNISLSGVPITGSPFRVDIDETQPSVASTDDPSPPASSSDTKVLTDVTWTDAFVKCEHSIVVKFSRAVFPSDVSARFTMSDSLPAAEDPEMSTEEARNHRYTEARVMSTGEGRYRVVYTPPTAGKLIMSVFRDGQPIVNSPFAIIVHPLHPDSTIVSPDQLGKCLPTTAVLDMPFALILLTCDHRGERLTSGGYRFTAGVTTSSSPESKQQGAVKDNEDGSYTVTITPRASELLLLNIYVCGYPLTSGMPLEIPVQDSLPFRDPRRGYKKPLGMAVDMERKAIYIADTVRAGCHIHQLAADGSFVSTKTITLSQQRSRGTELDLAVARDGRLLFLVPYFQYVETRDCNGKFISRWPCADDNRRPVGITPSRADHVIVGDGDSQQLFIHQRGGEIIGRIQLPEGALSTAAHNVCVDRADEILVVTHSDPCRILRYTMKGELIRTIEVPAQTQHAMAAEATPEGALVVSVPKSILVLAFTPNREAVETVKEFNTEHAYTSLAVVGDECFVAFDPAAKHLAKYSYYTPRNVLHV